MKAQFILCTIIIEFYQGQENKELKKALKLTCCCEGGGPSYPLFKIKYIPLAKFEKKPVNKTIFAFMTWILPNCGRTKTHATH